MSTAIGRSFVTTIIIEKDDADWKASVRLEEGLHLEGEADWQKRVVDAVCTDKTQEDAYKTAMRSVLDQYKDLALANGSPSMFPTIVPS